MTTEDTITVPELSEITITWTGNTCKVSFGGVLIEGAINSSESTNERFGVAYLPVLFVDDERKGEVGETTGLRYSFARAKQILEESMTHSLVRYLQERKLDAEESTEGREANMEDIQNAIGKKFAVGTLEGRNIVNVRGRVTTERLSAVLRPEPVGDCTPAIHILQTIYTAEENQHWSLEIRVGEDTYLWGIGAGIDLSKSRDTEDPNPVTMTLTPFLPQGKAGLHVDEVIKARAVVFNIAGELVSALAKKYKIDVPTED